MVISYRYAYLFISILFAIPWVILYIHRKDLQKKILLMSILVGIAAVIWEPYFLKDYWQPLYATKFPIEDFLYGFFGGGIVTSFYEEFFGKKFAKRKNRKHHWLWFVPSLAILGLLSFHIPFWFGLNSIYAAFISYVTLFCIMIFYRKDLFSDALKSGLFMAFITLIIYIFTLIIFPNVFIVMWDLPKLSHIFLLKIPLEEYLWAFLMGLAGGPVYEFFAGLRLANVSRK